MVKEILNLKNLTNVIGLELFNSLFNKQNFLKNAFSNNDIQNYLEKKTFLEKSNDKNFPKIQNTVSAVGSTTLQIFLYGKTQKASMISSRHLADQ